MVIRPDEYIWLFARANTVYGYSPGRIYMVIRLGEYIWLFARANIYDYSPERIYSNSSPNSNPNSIPNSNPNSDPNTIPNSIPYCNANIKRETLLTFHSKKSGSLASQDAASIAPSPLNGTFEVQITLMHDTSWHSILSTGCMMVERMCV